MAKAQTKSKQRVADHGEVFTAQREVNAMLDLVKRETERIDSRFLEPACGDGNFLAEILRRKLAVVKSRYGGNAADYERYAVIAATSIYGIDILQDNVDECRRRLFDIWDEEYTISCKKGANDKTRAAVRYILEKNIIRGDACPKAKPGNPKPNLDITIAEWSAVNGCLIKRRDFDLQQMLDGHDDEYENPEEMQTSLFSQNEKWAFDAEIQGYIPTPIEENYPPIHYRRLPEHG